MANSPLQNTLKYICAHPLDNIQDDIAYVMSKHPDADVAYIRNYIEQDEIKFFAKLKKAMKPKDLSGESDEYRRWYGDIGAGKQLRDMNIKIKDM